MSRVSREEAYQFDSTLATFAALDGGQRSALMQSLHSVNELRSVMKEIEALMHYFPTTTEGQKIFIEEKHKDMIIKQGRQPLH